MSAPRLTFVNSNKAETADSTDPGVVTITKTAAVTAQYSALPSSSADVISFYVSGTSTIYLNGQPPAATDSNVYAPPATVTVVPVQSAAADPNSSTLSQKTTIRVTQYQTVTGTLSIAQSASLEIKSTFTGMRPGGWNGTVSGSHAVGTGPTNVAPTAYSTGVLSYAAVSTTAATSFSAQGGFGASNPVTLATADPTFNFDTTYPVASLSTLAAKSGFEVSTTPLYPNGTSVTSKPFQTPLSSESSRMYFHLVSYLPDISNALQRIPRTFRGREKD